MIDIRCTRGAVVAADSHGARAGADILRRGGNAVDAVVAAALVQCVTQPHNVGLGGYAGTAAVYVASRREVVAVDFDSLAPAASTPDMFVSAFDKKAWLPELHDSAYPSFPNHRGYMAVTAPPVVAGLAFLLEHLGTISFSEAAEAAQRVAEEGFPIYPTLAGAMARFAEHADPTSLAAFLPDGRVPAEGETFVQRDLARLISRLREEGPRSFYEGEIAQAIVDAVRNGGGILEMCDFEAVRPAFERLLSIEVGGRTVHTPAPPSGGLTSLQILRIVEQLGLSDGSDLYGGFIEAARHAWSDRYECLGDPSFVDVPEKWLLSEDHTREIARKIRDGAAPPSTGLNVLGAEHTVHLVAADSSRNLASLTCTHGAWFGANVAVPGPGLVLGNGMSRFDPVPGRANSIAPGKRMLHNMCPMIITEADRPYCAIGLPGGRKIVNVAALLAHGIAVRDLTCGQAIDLPRFHVEGPGPALVDDPGTAAALISRFGPDYPVRVSEERLGGPVAAVMVKGESVLAASQHGPSCVAVDETG